MSFDRCIFMSNHHYNQDTEHFYHTQKFPLALLQSILSSTPNPRQLPTCFLSLEISLLFLELYINGVVQYVLFYVQLISLSTMFCEIHPCYCVSSSSFPASFLYFSLLLQLY